MRIAIPRELFPGERRVAIVPALVPSLVKAGLDIGVEAGAGLEAGFRDEEYADKGATIVPERADLLGAADVVLQVRGGGAAPSTLPDLELMRPGQIVIGLQDPLGGGEALGAMAKRGVTTFALELLPRITRAQSMDVLSSMATIAGYKAVLVAATHVSRMFPMLMTAAGTVAPSRVFVIGAGVAGLQAIATARRLGAKVEAYDVRPAVKEQIHSLGAKFVELPLETAGAEDKGGYATAQDETFYQRQRELLGRVVAASDVVITTAAVPGKRSPVLVTREMVASMPPGSVIVDLAAERGGNCELTRADEVVVEHGVTILGPTNLASTVPHHASQMYGKNVATFLLSIVKEGQVVLDMDDEVVRDTLVTRDGEVVHPRVREAMGLPAPVGA
ncbi:MAG: Re/Si-specific NAD(P)(+) transhydrogenase subunit alpha [Vicinamibacteraceae bacterium]|nr:Re/Si-specific NAD(P)(+) transhydrogenase subunit alpha [Vicinamibacteraceae bacterium]